jgi:ketosteroid isomerase-like protein
MARSSSTPFLRASVLAVLLLPIQARAQLNGDRAVNAALDALHRAAAEADYDAYMGAYTDDAVFLGTDATERWTMSEFAAYAKPSFDRGQGWTYVPIERWVTVSDDGDTAWFDERLDNATLGETRGSGVLVRTTEGWKVAQYNLTIPIPNAIAREVADRIRATTGGG